MKKIRKNFFPPRRFYTLYEQKFSNLRQLVSIFSPKEPENIKKSLDVGLREVGAKRLLNGVRKTDTKKILLSKAKFAPKQIFFARRFYTLF